MRIAAEHFGAGAFGRSDDRRIGARAGDIQAAGDAAAQSLRAAFEGDELHVDIILGKEPQLLGDVGRNMNHVGRRDRHAEDNFSFGLRLEPSAAKAIQSRAPESAKLFSSEPPFPYSRSSKFLHGAMRPSIHLASDISPTPNIITTTIGTKSLSVSKALA